MVKRFVKQGLVALFAAVFLGSVWATQSPIGSLMVKGRVGIDVQGTTFTLVDQEYAYFSNDKITTDRDGQAVLTITEGLELTLINSSSARVDRAEDGYNIHIDEGVVLVNARADSVYRIFHKGDAVSPGQEITASNEPFIVTVSSADDKLEFYMPSQLETSDEDEGAGWLKGSLAKAGYTKEQIAAIVALLVSLGFIIADDKGSSS